MTKRASVTIGDKVRALRLELDLSQLDLAKLAGIRPETVSRIENNKTGALETLHKVAPHLGTTIDGLLSDDAAQQAAGPNKAKTATKETKGKKRQ